MVQKGVYCRAPVGVGLVASHLLHVGSMGLLSIPGTDKVCEVPLWGP